MIVGPGLLTMTLMGVALTAGMTRAEIGPGQGRMYEQIRPGSPTIIVNHDQLQGKWKQCKGELKQRWVDFTDDDLLAIEGSVDKLEGKIQERYGDRREEVKRWVDEWFDRHGALPRES